ncbi:MAG: GGDEF domain-containing protein [Acidimicrobiia bacterium]
MSITFNEKPSKIVDLSAFIGQADAAARERPVAVAVADLDRFAAINETFGTATATRGLAAWERTLTGSLPDDAVVARISGDEWAIALPGATAESALIVLEEIRSHFSSHRVDGIDVDLDVSIGIAGRPPHAPTIEDAARAAVEALMRAKREGRGRVVIYVEEKMTMKSNYYPRASLDRLAKLSAATERTEASLLREALDDLFRKHRDEL